MNEKQRKALKMQAAIADYLANYGSSLYDQERRTLEGALDLAQKASQS
jgi:Tfp pilus assembly protein PilF